MKSIILLNRIAQQVRQRSLQFKRNYAEGKHAEEHHHHDPLDHRSYSNPGPPITLDYMPIPFQSYEKVHKELNRKFNMFLFICKYFFMALIYKQLKL